MLLISLIINIKKDISVSVNFFRFRLRKIIDKIIPMPSIAKKGVEGRNCSMNLDQNALSIIVCLSI